MLFVDLLFVLVLALILSSVLAWGFGWRHPARADAVGASMLFLFFILMLAMWAGWAWLPAWGPLLYGTPWLTLLLVGVLLSLLVLALVVPSRPTRPPRGTTEPAEDVAAVGTIFGIFFWILMVGLLIAIISRYLV